MDTKTVLDWLDEKTVVGMPTEHYAAPITNCCGHAAAKIREQEMEIRRQEMEIARLRMAITEHKASRTLRYGLHGPSILTKADTKLWSVADTHICGAPLLPLEE